MIYYECGRLLYSLKYFLFFFYLCLHFYTKRKLLLKTWNYTIKIKTQPVKILKLYIWSARTNCMPASVKNLAWFVFYLNIKNILKWLNTVVETYFIKFLKIQFLIVFKISIQTVLTSVLNLIRPDNIKVKTMII